MKTLFRSLLVVGGMALAGCDVMDEALAAASDQQRHQEDFKFSYDLKPGGRVSLDGFNGGVEIFGWSQDKIEINGTKYSSDRAKLAEIKIDIAHTADSVQIRAVRPERPHRWRGNMGVKFVLHVPRKTLLESIASSNGPILIEGLEGDARLRTSNGPVKLISFRGDASVKTSNGPVEVKDFSGALVAETSNGPVRGDGVKGHLDVTTSNGPVAISAADLASGKPVRIKTSNGSVRLAMNRLTTDVIAHTSNGPIELRLPAGSGANVRAETRHGKVESDFDVSATTQSKSELAGRIGGGGPSLELETSNGNIRLARGN